MLEAKAIDAIYLEFVPEFMREMKESVEAVAEAIYALGAVRGIPDRSRRSRRQPPLRRRVSREEVRRLERGDPTCALNKGHDRQHSSQNHPRTPAPHSLPGESHARAYRSVGSAEAQMRVEGDGPSAPSNLTRWWFESPNRATPVDKKMGFEGPKPSTAFRFSHSAFPKMHAPAAPNPAPPHRLVIKCLSREALLARPVAIPGIVSGACLARCVGP